MNENGAFVNISGPAALPVYLKVFFKALFLMFDRDNVRIRKESNINAVDTLFNFVKLSFLQRTILKYRRMVKAQDAVIMDSTFPPYPSPVFDKRIANYLNHLDLTELPSGIVSISTTNCCPYSCAFCSTNAKRNLDSDLDEELLKTTITEVENFGVPMIILHGGEPFYRYRPLLAPGQTCAQGNLLVDVYHRLWGDSRESP